MIFEDALKELDAGNKITDGTVILQRAAITTNEDEIIHVVGEKLEDGSFTQVMPCGAYYRSNWEIVKE